MSKRFVVTRLVGLLAAGVVCLAWAEADMDLEPSLGAEAPDPSQVKGGEKAAIAEPEVALPWKADMGWEKPPRVDLAGCTAEAICVHNPPNTISCSSPVNGTCVASGAGCGTVECNGQITRCPGYCLADHHCATFCNLFENPNSYCNTGCCECVP